MTAVWFIVLAAERWAAVGAWFGDRYYFFPRVDLPQWFADGAGTATAIATGLLAVAGHVLAAGALGGWLGTRYHRRADRLIAATRPGGVVTPERHRGACSPGPSADPSATTKPDVPPRLNGHDDTATDGHPSGEARAMIGRSRQQDEGRGRAWRAPN